MLPVHLSAEGSRRPEVISYRSYLRRSQAASVGSPDPRGGRYFRSLSRLSGHEPRLSDGACPIGAVNGSYVAGVPIQFGTQPTLHPAI